jgi:hypothetical protein
MTRTLAIARPAFRIATLVATDALSLFVAVLLAFSYWAIVNPTIPRHHLTMYLTVGAVHRSPSPTMACIPGIGLNAVQHMQLYLS